MIELTDASHCTLCSIFGGCSGQAGLDVGPAAGSCAAEQAQQAGPWPPLLWRLTRRNQSRIFVYYLGHGLFQEAPDRQSGRRLLLPVDAVGPDRRACPAKGYPVQRLHEQLQASGARASLVILDAGFPQRPISCGDPDPLAVRLHDAQRTVYADRLQAARLPGNMAELTAAGPFEIGHCHWEFRDRLFTRRLLEAVAPTAATGAPLADQIEFGGDGDGDLSFGELATYLRSNVMHDAKFQYGRSQTVTLTGDAQAVLLRADEAGAAAPPGAQVTPVLPSECERDANGQPIPERCPPEYTPYHSESAMVTNPAAAPPAAATPAEDDQPISLSPTQIELAQRALTVEGWNPGCLDGTLGAQTQAAIARWRLASRSRQAGPLTEAEFKLLAYEFGRKFEQAERFPAAGTN